MLLFSLPLLVVGHFWIKRTASLRYLKSVYYGYVNRLLVVVGDFTTNGL
jgi:hypothetical protein